MRTTVNLHQPQAPALRPETVPSSDAQLELVEVQPAGGRRMSGAELLRGRPAFDGSRAVPSADAGA